MQCVILAGGLATRMRPATETLPKSLLQVAGKPFLDHQFRLLATQGVTDVVLCIGHLGKQIRAVAGDGSAWNLRVTYSDEGDTLLGTGGALRKAVADGLAGEGFFVLYGDSYLPIDMKSVWSASDGGRKTLMTVFKNNNQWDTSNVVLEEGRVALYEKNILAGECVTYIDFGLSVLTREAVLEGVPGEESSDLGELFKLLSRQGNLIGYEVHRRFYEIGSAQGLADLEAYLSGTPD